MQGRLQSRALEMRSQGRGRTGHARVPSALAELQSGWEMFLQFAREVGAIGLVEKEELEQKGGEALAKMAAFQAKYQAGSDPAVRFIALLRAALGCGCAHVADPRGRPPAEAASWGWKRQAARRGWT